MQPAPSTSLAPPPIPAMPQLSEKPHQGFATKKTALHPASSVPNFRVTLGLRAVVVENGVREIYSARYYNPQTGRFLSRDPEDGKIKIPATLHKYLYANGDPVNRIDPRGREADEEAVLTYTEIGVRTVPEIKELAGAIACVFAVELYVLDLAREQVDSIDKWGGGAGVIGGCALYLWTY
jgi:RHS repeat-associated protein